MKKLILSIVVATGSFVATSQVIFSAQSPASVAGLYSFTSNGDGSSWGLLNLNNPADAITAELMLVEDGTPGTNPQGHPISQEGCDPLTNDLTGKIAVIYRNTCGFGVKCLNAQTAGAIGVIVVNREPGLVNMSGGTEGTTVMIPVTFINDTDGAALISAMGSGPVVVFIGNKQGVFANDIGSLVKDRIVPTAFSYPTTISNTAAELSFDLGIQVRNFGSANQTGATVTANVDFGGSSVYNEISPAFDILSGDSAMITFSPLSLASYSNAGKYSLSYTINLTSPDDDTTDNVYTTEFQLNDTLFSLAPLDAVTNYPISTGGTQPSTFTNEYGSCIVFRNAKADSIAARGIYFSAMTNLVDSLMGQSITVAAYKVVSTFVDLNDAPAAGSVDIGDPVAIGYYYYPDGLQENLQKTVIYQPFDNEIVLENDARYLFCASASSKTVFIGYNTKLNYEMNVSYYAQPLVPVVTDGSTNLVGFGGDNVPAIAVQVESILSLGVKENKTIEGKVYPNPATDEVYVSMKAEGSAKLIVTDISGKTVMNNTINLVDGKSKVNMASLTTGMYIFNVVLENGTSSQFNVVKK